MPASLDMQKQRRHFLDLALATILPGILTGSAALAQFGPPAPKPAVTAQATQPLAYEPGGHAGVFTLSRGEDTNAAATITYSLAGSATNGVDYLTAPTSVTLAAGQSETNILITPVAEAAATGYKTVQLELPQTKGRFSLSGRGTDMAVVYIAYDYTNVAPTIAIGSPPNDASFLSRPNIVILARAGDSNGWVTSVEFFAGAISLATVTNQPFPSGPFRPPAASGAKAGLPPIVRAPRNNSFMIIWTNVPPGAYALTAVATDNAGLQTTSPPVNITVTTRLPAPAVRIAAPMNGSSFPSNADINIVAAAGETGGAIATVEFLAQGKSLGVVTNNPAWPWPAPEFPAGSTNIPWTPFSFLWTNAPAGTNTVRALASDNNGTQVLSAPVTIDVLTNSYHPRHWR
ncbi:MAG: Ig-like domain-containing protein [Verrucomicrobiota bacterium]